jgi:poly [ADP-ribose] polymerase
MNFKCTKVLNNLNNGYSQTTKFKTLHCTNLSGNNNKFYCLEIQKDPKTSNLRLFSHYGRLGYTNIYEIRKEENDVPITDESIIEEEFERIIKKKLKGKKVKEEDGSEHVEKYEIVDVFAPTVGSENVVGKNTKTVEVKLTKKDVVSSYSHPEVSRIIKQVVDENIHNISSLTSLKLTSNGFETPLGPVTKEHVQKAREPLDVLKNLLVDDKLNPDLKSVKENNSKYFSLIPHSFGHKIVQEDWILDVKKLSEEYELLDNLETAVQMSSSLQNSSQQKSALGSDIELIEDIHEIDRIENYIVNSKASNHRGTDVWNWKLRKVFKIRIPDERSRFETAKKQYGKECELFHGSKNCNVLSILKSGLIVPPVNSGVVTGRMFGNGLYFADNSSKSLNYSVGFWGGRSNKFSNSFLFLANVCMGKAHIAHSSTPSGAPRGYDSIHAKKGSSLYNDEFIVYKLNQATLTYLVEMSK